MTSREEAVVELDGVTKNFGASRVLNNVTVKLGSADIVVICGPSGAGKSTLIRTVNGLEPIDRGSIRYRGVTLERKTRRLFREHIGMVFQQFNLFKNLTIRDNLCLPPVKVKGASYKGSLARAIDWLEKFGLADKIDAFPGQLSGGQQQRVAIIRALMMDPDVMLFDEPTSALDPETTGDVLEAIRSVADMGMTVVVVTHEIEFFRTFANRYLFLERGEVLFDGSVDEFFSANGEERIRRFISRVA